MNKLKIIALLMLSTSVTASFAESRTHKAPLKVDFNQLIDEGNIDRAELGKAAAVPEQAEAQPTKNRRKVIDFIDMEVSVGAESSVVDSN